MKEEWKPDALRETAEEIRSAVMPKSITPEMVGGTLLALTNAVGEVVETLGEIPREHVKVRVKAYDGNGKVSAEGAKVEVEIFCVNGFPCTQLEKREIEVDANGCVEFDVPHGFTYSVQSKLTGMGASFQLVNDATRKERVVNLWHMPVGIFAYGQIGTRVDGLYNCPSYPHIRPSFEDDDWEYNWINDDLAEDFPDLTVDDNFGTDEACWRGILVSTADTAFVIMPQSFSSERMQWSGAYGYGVEVPYCANYNPDDMIVEEGEDVWDAAQALAREDYSGHSNSVKILRSCITPTAAEWCASMPSDWYDQHNFLPSAGQLYLMWLNRTAINSLMQYAIDEWNWEYVLLPYLNDKKQWVFPSGRSGEYWWSSTQAGGLCSWVVNYNGGIDYLNRYDTNDVRAVSAFHFEY